MSGLDHRDRASRVTAMIGVGEQVARARVEHEPDVRARRLLDVGTPADSHWGP